MRVMLAVLIWVVFVGGTYAYLAQREIAAPIKEFVRPEAEGIYTLELTTTFSAEPDAFTLPQTSLVIRLKGKVILTRKERLEVGEQVRVKPVPGMEVGENEFFIEANPPDDMLQRSNAIRLRIFRDNEQLVDETIWSDPGVKPASTIRLKVSPPEVKKGDTHAD